MEKTRKIQSIIQDVIEGRKDNNEATIDILALCDVSGWLFLAKTYPKLENKEYTVLDKYGNIEENVLFGCSGFMNEPYSFFEGKIVKAKDIIAYR